MSTDATARRDGLPTVAVLLSTCDGARFLPQLLASLAAQDHPSVELLVRDDGSRDATPNLLRQWAASGRPMRLMNGGGKLGAPASFLNLLKQSGGAFDYFAFCDQDDLWKPEKLSRAVAALAPRDRNQPILYCTRQEYIDQEGHPLGLSPRPLRDMGFANALVENVATGCTLVLNHAARNLVLSRPPERPVMHDWWCYLTVSAFGSVLYDDWPSIGYRQHGGNQVGVGLSPWRTALRRLSRLLSGDRNAYRAWDQASEFQRLWGDQLPEDEQSLLREFLKARSSLGGRVRYLFRAGVYRQSRLDDLLLRALILAGRY